MNNNGFPFWLTGYPNVVQTNGAPSVTGDLPSYSDTSGQLVGDSGIASANVFLTDGTVPMSGTLDMGGNDVINTGTVRPRDDNTFDCATSSKRYKTAYVYDIDSVNNNLPYLRLDGSNNMTGNVNVNNHDVTSTGNVYPGYPNTFNLGLNGYEYKDIRAVGVLYGSNDALRINSIVAQSNQRSDLSTMLSPICPAGLRDFWQVPAGLSFDIQNLIYNNFNDHLYGVVTTPGLKFSTDGGITWNDCAFDVGPASSCQVVGFYSIVICFDNANVYTSSDGENFLQGGAFLGSFGYDIAAFSGLYITGQNVDSSHSISSSSDGLTWVSATTSDFSTSVNGPRFAQSATVLVCCGSTSDYSLDGLTWTNSPSFTLSDCQSVAYSSDLNQFLAVGASGNAMVAYTGIDDWQNVGMVAPIASIGLIWVGAPISRWYISKNTGTGTNYNIWTTADAYIPFASCNLDGSQPNVQAYSGIVHLGGAYNRFVIGLNSVGVAYSTSRPTVIKSTSDSILVRNSGPILNKYKMIGGANDLIAPGTETSIFLNGAFTGSRTFDAMAVGTLIKIHFIILAGSLTAAHTLTLILYMNANVMATCVLTGPVSYINEFEMDLYVVDPAASNIFVRQITDQALPALQWTGAAMDATVPNVLDITGTLSDAGLGDDCLCSIADISVSYA